MFGLEVLKYFKRTLTKISLKVYFPTKLEQEKNEIICTTRWYGKQAIILLDRQLR